MTDKDQPRLYVTIGLFILFGYVLYYNVDNQMLIGAIIGSFGTAITFWLGSSKGSADKSSQIERMESHGTEENPTVIEGVHSGEAITTKPERRKG